MTLSKLDRFANSGTKSEPTSGKKALGFVGGEQPTAEECNWLFGEWVDKINEVIDEGVSVTSPDYTNTNIITRYIPAGDNWGSASSSANMLDTSVYDLLDLEVYFDDDGLSRLLTGETYDASNRAIIVIDPETMTIESNSGDLGGSLTCWTTSRDTVKLVSFCTDGTSVYVMFLGEKAAAADEWAVQAYDIDGWTVKSGWTSAGVLLPDNLAGISYPDTNREFRDRVQVVSGTQIIAVIGGAIISSSATDGAFILAMDDGTVETYGEGDSPVSTKNVTLTGAVASDGTNVYLGGYCSSDLTYTVFSAQIADMTSGSLSFTMYNPSTTSANVTDLLYDGTNLYTSLRVTSGACLLVGNDTIADMYSFTSNNTNVGDLVTIMRMVYDGLHLWAVARVRGPNSGEYYPAFVKLNTDWGRRDIGVASPSYGALEGYVMGMYALDHAALSTATEATCKGPIAYDGRHVYMINKHSVLNSYLYRLPQALIRG